MVLRQDLKLVGHLVGADFVDFEQVDGLLLFTHVKVPDSVQLASQAVYGLISFDKARV